MEARKEKLLNLVVKTYIDSAEPVGSRFLVGKGGLNCGEATVRNELHDLEEEGYLTHPHTSAGRIPTEKGYRYYIENIDLKRVKLSRRDADFLYDAMHKDDDYELARKNLAKTLVELSDGAIILAFSLERVYYTGLSNLFNKPEFHEFDLIEDISKVFDHCEENLEKFFDKVESDPKYFIGDEHPFGSVLSVLSARFGRNNDNLIVLLGPHRMDYRHNFGLIKKVMEII